MEILHGMGRCSHEGVFKAIPEECKGGTKPRKCPEKNYVKNRRGTHKSKEGATKQKKKNSHPSFSQELNLRSHIIISPN
jgi:hypothetical protein